jgi:hypothetical protein
MSFLCPLDLSALAHVALLAALAASAEPAAPSAETAAEQDVAPSAREVWKRACAATLLRPGRTVRPVTALDLRFELLTRGDQGSNELKPRVRWLADSRIRIELASGRELGRGRDGDWLLDGNEVVRFRGREYAEDRRQIDEFLTIVQDFVALTQPAKLDVENLTLADAVELEFPKHHPLDKPSLRERLVWLRFESGDLVLPGAGAWAGALGEKQRVLVAIDSANHLPAMALIVDGKGERAPMLLALSETRALDDLRVPHRVHVYPVRPAVERNRTRWIVAEKPSQEFYLIGGTLRARLTEEDFALPNPDPDR